VQREIRGPACSTKILLLGQSTQGSFGGYRLTKASVQFLEQHGSRKRDRSEEVLHPNPFLSGPAIASGYRRCNLSIPQSYVIIYSQKNASLKSRCQKNGGRKIKGRE